MLHALLLSPVSMLPTVVSTNSKTYPELMQAGYQFVQYGTRKDLTEIESEMLSDIYSDCLDLNDIN